LPTLFTAGNIFLGYLSIIRSIQGTVLYASNPALAAQNFRVAAYTIGFAVFFDGLDGRIARMTNTTSAFGRELDSLADIISFGIAPAILAYTWGVLFVAKSYASIELDQLQRAGKFLAFLFLVCGAARLARFNIQVNPQPRNPGAPNRKYFVGLPIPAAAALLAAIVFAAGGKPITEFLPAALWLTLTTVLSLLMISAWRYWSFKELNLLRPRSPLLLVVTACVIFAIWSWSEEALLILTSVYAASGVITRIGGILRRWLRPTPKPETQLG
jgi:CDP-diacylglycerol--serine O-phosphatidyltransferase